MSAPTCTKTTATIMVPVTTRIVAVDHVGQSITVSVRACRYESLRTLTVTEDGR